MTTPAQAQDLARRLLQDPLPRRWAHTQGVAATAAAIAAALTRDPDVIIAAAWLHDIGYAPAIADRGTGFHPLDGARYLRDTDQASPLIRRLVAHHSYALDGAAELGLADDLACEFASPPGDLADALTYCDMTTGPDGEPVPVGQRLAEICARYGPGHTVTRAITKSAPQIAMAVDRVSDRLAGRSAGTVQHATEESRPGLAPPLPGKAVGGRNSNHVRSFTGIARRDILA
jgi:putative nucleotidyltransferase with HDIG domain